jgi:hypothetical protein
MEQATTKLMGKKGGKERKIRRQGEKLKAKLKTESGGRARNKRVKVKKKKAN